MSDTSRLILKDDGFPVTAALRGVQAVTIHPRHAAAWICLYVETDPHEAPEVRDRFCRTLPPERFQLSLDPMTAHRLGQYLIEKAHAAVVPD